MTKITFLRTVKNSFWSRDALMLVATGLCAAFFSTLVGAQSLQITSDPAQPSGMIGTSYTQVLTVTGGTAPYIWVLQSGSLPAGLALSRGPNSAMLTISGTPTTVGTQTFAIYVTDNNGLAASQTFSVNILPVNCSYSLGTTALGFAAAGGSGSFSVTTGDGCPWTVTGAPTWITINPVSGFGTGTVGYTVAPNPTSNELRATLSVGGVAIKFEEGSALLGYMPHLAAEGGWNTSFTLVNKDSVSVAAGVSFLDNSGNSLPLPVLLPQQPTSATTTETTATQTIAPNASFIVEATGPENVPYVQGSAQILGTGPVDGFAIFHYDPSGQEAVVPFGGSGLILPFDNTNGVTTGVAVYSQYGGTTPILLLDDSGNLIGTGTESITILAEGHTSFVLPDQFPVTANRRGTVVLGTCYPDMNPVGGGSGGLNCPAIETLGIRYTPPGTLTTIPSLGNQTGGVMPHIASGNGWQTTFVLSNVSVPALPGNPAGITSAQATLSFFDDNGNPLTLPLAFPQTGATMTASSVTQTIPANGTLYIQTSGDVGTALLTGSAQLTGANGFAIFRYNPNGQEAVVPIQQTPSTITTASVLAFDNTSNIATGVAISNGSAQAVTIPVAIRDDQGNQIGTSTISLPANGHTSFMLATQYPVTANIRGTLEFAIPGAGTSSAATIGVLGIRSPPQLTFTTLPALPK